MIKCPRFAVRFSRSPALSLPLRLACLRFPCAMCSPRCVCSPPLPMLRRSPVPFSVSLPPVFGCFHCSGCSPPLPVPFLSPFLPYPAMCSRNSGYSLPSPVSSSFFLSCFLPPCFSPSVLFSSVLFPRLFLPPFSAQQKRALKRLFVLIFFYFSDDTILPQNTDHIQDNCATLPDMLPPQAQVLPVEQKHRAFARFKPR